MINYLARCVGIVASLGTMLGLAGVSPSVHAQTLTTLYSFYCAPYKSNCADGVEPTAGLVQATNGGLYGVNQKGGADEDVLTGGTVFRISTSGHLTPLYSFCGDPDCSTGYIPQLALTLATNGDLYGTTSNDAGGGTVFKMTPGGTLTTLHTFAGGSDGDYPYGTLVQAVNGYLYGTTIYGGAHQDGGIIFRITPTGAYEILYNFCAQTGCLDGKSPSAGLVQANNGNLYGTTSGGGAYAAGTIFEITPSGTLTTLYSFCAQSGCPDGQYPETPLIQAIDGNLYGTTGGGGANRNAGAVFKFTPGGILTTLHSFCADSQCTDGAVPFAGLMQATNGELYGTTYHGGVGNHGTVFQITTSGTLTSLYSFCALAGCGDGETPFAPLTQSTNGNLYGTTLSGGSYRGGTVFQLSLGLGEFVETLPTSAAVGAAITILGTNLTGATSVTFSGIPAAFTVASATAIKTTVPAGTTVGPVVVTLPTGALSSYVPFRAQ